MKKTVLLFMSLTLMMASCTTVKFESPVPAQAKTLHKFPAKMRGKFIDTENKDTLVVRPASFRYGNRQTLFRLSGKLTDKDHVILKRFGDAYLLNIRPKDDKLWDVLLLKSQADKLYVYYLLIDGDDEAKAEKLKQLGSITGLIPLEDTYAIHPTDGELKKIIDAGLFAKVMEFNRIE